MYIEVHLILGICHEDVRDRIGRDPSLRKIDVSRIRLPMSSESPDFERIIEITRDLKSGGLLWTPLVRYSKAEELKCNHFEIWPRRSIPAGYAWQKNQDLLWGAEPVETLPGLFVRILNQVRIATLAKHQRNLVGNLDESYMELIAGTEALKAFALCELSGLSSNPVLCGRAEEPHPDFHHLV